MDWIFNNFEIVALIILALGSAIKQLIESAKSKREAQPRRDEQEEDETTWFPIPIPPEYLPKPPPLPETFPPPPLYKAQPPPLTIDTEEELHRQMEMQEKLREHREIDAALKAKAKETLLRTGQLKRPANPPANADIRTVLRNPSSTRQAIVLREILGPPVSMR